MHIITKSMYKLHNDEVYNSFLISDFQVLNHSQII